MPDDATAHDPWNDALSRYREIAVDAARYNVALLETLRSAWQPLVRPDTSMFRVLFTRYGQTGYEYHERIEVEYESTDRVRIALARQVPRRGDDRRVGPVIVAGDFARPENSVPVVESFLMQLAGA
ncbi:hypothetical protein [Cellulomonas sp. SLBN-39]|uniref:hypothetical protein n=1 Tax=Cellulomonas sp. SLBN-39 TaxID=2768446 RepID=UPI0011548E43|nr:hypothetical protein [Cellulomonas sp. SLBN-39]TQL04600.1 hypothetical protein FBY24_3721 [Cellulomonas sp. SLBN-39]